MRDSDRPARALKWGIVLGLLALSAAAFVLLRRGLGPPAGILLVLPVIAAAWFFGLGVSLVFIAAALGLASLLSWLIGFPPQILLLEPGGVIVLLLAALVALDVARLGELTRQHRQEVAARERTLAEQEVQVRFMTLLSDIVRTALQADDTPTLLQVLAEPLAELFGADACVITLQEQGGKITLPAGDPSARPLLDPALQRSLTRSVLEARHALVMGESGGQPPLETEGPVQSALGLPLILPEQNMGAVILGFCSARNFSTAEIERGELAARQISLALTKVLLLEETRKRIRELSTLHAVAAAATQEDDEDDLIQRVTLLIGESLYPDSFGILLLDQATGELRLHSSYQPGTDLGALRLPKGVGITGSVVQSGMARRVQDIAAAPEYLSVHPRTRSELCVPLKVEEQVIGVVNAESETVNAFSEQDEALLTILAGQLSTAIQRLRTAKAEHNQAKQLSRSNALIRALAQLGARAAAVTDPDGVMQTLGNELAKLGLRCLIALGGIEGQPASLRYTSLPKHAVASIERISGRKFQDYAIPREQFFSQANALQGPLIIRDPVDLVLGLFPDLSRQVAAKFLKVLGVIQTTSVCQLPLVSEGKLIGTLWMWGEGLHANDLPTLSLFASQVATALQNANLLAEVQRLAITDELTGVFNRRYFFNRAEVEFSRAKRYSHPLTALVADIDHFKQFNDRYGHLVGDQVLQEVARLMLTSLRDSDILGRYGGEEFSILLPDTDVKAAASAAERLLTRIADTPIETEAGSLQVQVSIGVAGLGKAAPTLHDLINRADQAMYQAKEAGRNRVAVK